MTIKTLEQLNASIMELAQAERITKQVLAELSRDLLTYVIETGDVRPVNRLLGLHNGSNWTLSAANWRMSVLYFKHFIPFSNNYKADGLAEKGVQSGRRNKDVQFYFGKQLSNKRQLSKKVKAIEEWLADPENNLWVWQADNVSTQKKPEFTTQITNSVKKALEGDEERQPLTAAQVMDAVLSAGVSPEDLFAALQGGEQQQDEAA